MSFHSSPYNSLQMNDSYEFEDELIDFYDEQNTNYQNQDESEEDTDEASEIEYLPHSNTNNINNNNRNNNEPIEIKEQMYQDKLSNFKKQLDELKAGSHPEYVRRIKRLEYQYKERLRLNDAYREYLTECVERDYILEKKAAIKEYDEKKSDLRENLLTDFEDRRKIIESERHTMELTGDSMEIKPTVTRKLRRRPNDPLPVVEKRRKPAVGQLTFLLDDKDIDNDLKLISRGKTMTPLRPHSNNGIPCNIPVTNNDTIPLVETKIEDGKLLYERRWFHRGQPVYVEGKDIIRFAASISAIGNEVICVKKINDNSKVRIYTSQLSRGKVSIKRRAN